MLEIILAVAALIYLAILSLYIYEYGELRIRFASRLAVLAAGGPVAGFLIAGAIF